MRKFVFYIVVFVCGAAAGLFLPRLCPFLRLEIEGVERTDTRTVRDTTADRKPGVAEIMADRLMFLKVPSFPELPDIAFVSDTMYMKDTVYVPVRWVQHKYDRPDYQAWVSGYQIGSRGPQLDSIWVYPETRYVTRTVRPAERRNSIALESSASWCGSMSLTISAEYEHSWRWCYVGAGVGYDVVTRSPYIAVRAGVPIWSW